MNKFEDWWYGSWLRDAIWAPRKWFRTGFRRLKRFIVWFPVIWNDEDWDPAYLYDVMRFKISRLRKDMSKSQRHLGWEEDVKNMRICEELLRRHVHSDFYHENSEKIESLCTCKKEDRFLSWLDICQFCLKQYKIDQNKQKHDLEYCMKVIAKKSGRWWT